MPQNQKNQFIDFHLFKQLAILVILYNIIHTNYKVYKKYVAFDGRARRKEF